MTRLVVRLLIALAILAYGIAANVALIAWIADAATTCP